MSRRIRWQDANDVGKDVIVLAGQSEMVAYNQGPLEPLLDAWDSDVFQWPGSGSYMGQWVAGVDPLFHHEAQRAGAVGFGPAFARVVKRGMPRNRSLGLVPCAHGSTGFSTSSVSPAPAGYNYVAGGGWDPSGGQGGVNLYEFMIAQTLAALAENPNNRIVALYWDQGAADINLSQAAYAAKLDALITGFRTRVPGAANVPVMIGRAPIDYRTNPTYAAYANVDAAHIDTARRLPRVGLVGSNNTVGMLLADGLHYTATGSRLVGGTNAPRGLAVARANVLGVAPVAPGVPALTQSGTTVTASWARPLGRATDYTVQYSVDNGTTWQAPARSTPNIADTQTVTGLTLGQTVLVRVRTVNEQGNSAWSTSAPLTLLRVPNAASVATGAPGSVTMPVTITPGATDATHDAATAYLIEYKLSSANIWTTFATITGTTATVTGLTDTTSYDFRVTASNVAGAAAPSATVTSSTTAPQPLLDVLTAAGYVIGVQDRHYSPRRLRAAYGGSALRVRRSSDNTEQDIGFAAGTNNFDSAALLAFVGSGSGYVSKWYDQSGNGWHLTQATASAQERIVSAGVMDVINSRAATYSDGVDDGYLDTAHTGLEAAGPVCTLAVTKVPTTASALLWSEYGTTAYYVHGIIGASGTAAMTWKNDAAASGTGTSTTAVIAADVAHQWTFVDNGPAGSNVVAGFVDGAASGSGTFARAGAYTMTTFKRGGGTGATWWKGLTGELVILAGGVTASIRAAAEANQKAYYGTP